MSLQVGNVYVKFKEEEQAAAALAALSGRFYGGEDFKTLLGMAAVVVSSVCYALVCCQG